MLKIALPEFPMDNEWNVEKINKRHQTTPWFWQNQLERFYCHLLRLGRREELHAGGDQESSLDAGLTWKWRAQLWAAAHAGFVTVGMVGVGLSYKFSMNTKMTEYVETLQQLSTIHIRN